MKCPLDQTPLAMMERQGIEIDYCPTCRGVWLDRGELDKLINASPSEPYRPAQPVQREYHQEESHHTYPHKKRKESFLGDLFDF